MLKTILNIATVAVCSVALATTASAQEGSCEGCTSSDGGSYVEQTDDSYDELDLTFGGSAYNAAAVRSLFDAGEGGTGSAIAQKQGGSTFNANLWGDVGPCGVTCTDLAGTIDATSWEETYGAAEAFNNTGESGEVDVANEGVALGGINFHYSKQTGAPSS